MKCQISVRVDMSKCKYPDCFNCEYEDCIMEEQNLKKKEENVYDIPNCEKCEECYLIESDGGGVFFKACKATNRLIVNLQQAQLSPSWCKKRETFNKLVFDLKDVECGFICPNCKSKNQLVKDSRDVDGYRVRRRQCSQCGTNWNTVEVLYRHGYSDKTYI